MSNGRTITIARNHFIAGCVVILVLLVAVIYKLTSPPVPDNFAELNKVIAAEGASVIVIPAEDKALKVFGSDGTMIEGCKISDGEIPENCDLKGIDLTKISTVTILEYYSNPRCRAVYDENGEFLYNVHRTDPNRGRNPCHDPH